MTSYQTLLRALGAWLDEWSVSGMSAIETCDGWAVRYGFERYSPPQLLKTFHADELERLGSGRQALRDPNATRERKQYPYEDMLRALGFELDAAEAANVLMDLVEDTLLVTFQMRKPSEGFNWHKEMRVVTFEGRLTLVQTARSRRTPLPSRNWFARRIVSA